MSFDEMHQLIGYRGCNPERETKLRIELTERVRDAIQNTDDVQRYDLPTLMAENAIDAVVEFVREKREGR